MSKQLRQRNAQTFLDWRLAQLLTGNPVMPALGGGLVVKDEVVYVGVKGVRKRGTSTPAGIDDRFLLGSICKPLTGYLIAQLRRSGVLFWQRTIGETWPELIADLEQHLKSGDDQAKHVAHYAATDIPSLMTHTSGLDYSPGHVHGLDWEAKLKAVDANVALKLRERRTLHVRIAIRDQPYQGWSNTDGEGPPPTKYSGGCIVAAAMAEKVTGKRLHAHDEHRARRVLRAPGPRTPLHAWRLGRRWRDLWPRRRQRLELRLGPHRPQ